METKKIISKIAELNKTVNVSINKIPLENCADWKYDNSAGTIHNGSMTFFQIAGMCVKSGKGIICEQPIIIQNEIGYLGIIRKKINGEYQYLMQYKIEPGNINKIQVSPTIQATKSNFTQAHGGRKPAYLDYFINAGKYKIIVDQIQSEQSCRFLGKRNRNIVIELDENDNIEVLPSHDWMTLKQIKELMHYNSLVNMDTRTVLSCMPCSAFGKEDFGDSALYNSMAHGDEKNHFPEIYNYINNYKMFDETEKEIVPLYSLKKWNMRDNEFVCNDPYSFKVIFCDIEIEGREVRHWQQPLFEAMGIATFGLFTCVENGVRFFLVKCCSEVGCFDKIELGPSVQREYISNKPKDELDILFDKKVANKNGILFDTLLSEEGGRFYHEQNRNVIIEINKNEAELPDGCFWCDYKTLNELVQVNNTLNIQLRNLLSVLEF